MAAVTGCPDYQQGNVEEAIQRQFSLLNIEELINRGDSVLLKPNFIAAKASDLAVQTDPEVILAVAKAVKDLGAKPFVADSPAWNSVEACVRVLGLTEPLKKLDVPYKNLNKPSRRKIAGSSIGISRVALEADKIINLPKLKAHQQLGGTFAVKNMFGCVCGKEKAFRHFSNGKSYDGFCRMLIGIYEHLSPVVTIIDGVVAMEGMGPIRGTAKKLRVIVGGREPISCEMVCCELVNFCPYDMPIIETAKRIGFGCREFSEIEIVGDDHKQFVCDDFTAAERTELRFTFPRICKSMARQAILLGKNVFSNKT